MSEGQTFIKDDADADARAAYAEVMTRTKEPEVAPAESMTEQATEQPVAKTGTEVSKTSPASGTDRARDEHGRFVPKSETQVTQTSADKQADTKSTAGEQPKAAPAPQAAAPSPASPPSSWSVAAKTKWESIPDEIRAEIVKREGEVSEGLAALRDYADLKQFNDMARAGGTTLAQAMHHYVNMENILRRDPGAGMAMIAQNAGMTQAQAAQLFSRLAQQFGGGGEQQEADPLLEMINPVLQPLQAKLQALEGQLTARQQQEAAAYQQSLQREIDTFASDPNNRFFTNLSDTIAQLFERGMVQRTGNPAQDLRNAYDMAARMNPEVAEALIEQRLQAQEEAKRKREQEAAEKARAASRSISGSRAPGTVIRDAEPPSGADDVEADVRRALRQLTHA